ncbi:MAG: hypothetical protein ABIK44_07895, partial [candidate division WOR-3 bacterium]
VFWLQKGSRYIIAFVDPKGTEHTQMTRKLDGYRMLFEENSEPKVIRHNGLDVSVIVFIYPRDRAAVPERYRKYSVDSIPGMIERLQALL